MPQARESQLEQTGLANQGSPETAHPPVLPTRHHASGITPGLSEPTAESPATPDSGVDQEALAATYFNGDLEAELTPNTPDNPPQTGPFRRRLVAAIGYSANAATSEFGAPPKVSDDPALDAALRDSHRFYHDMLWESRQAGVEKIAALLTGEVRSRVLDGIESVLNVPPPLGPKEPNLAIRALHRAISPGNALEPIESSLRLQGLSDRQLISLLEKIQTLSAVATDREEMEDHLYAALQEIAPLPVKFEEWLEQVKRETQMAAASQVEATEEHHPQGFGPNSRRTWKSYVLPATLATGVGIGLIGAGAAMYAALTSSPPRKSEPDAAATAPDDSPQARIAFQSSLRQYRKVKIGEKTVSMPALLGEYFIDKNNFRGKKVLNDETGEHVGVDLETVICSIERHMTTLPPTPWGETNADNKKALYAHADVIDWLGMVRNTLIAAKSQIPGKDEKFVYGMEKPLYEAALRANPSFAEDWLKKLDDFDDAIEAVREPYLQIFDRLGLDHAKVYVEFKRQQQGERQK